jgi:hypothetical protein
MFNNIKRVAAVIALTGWMGVANASLIFDFSFGTTGNELIGEITGLVDGIDGQSQSAERMEFTTATGIYSQFINIQFDSADPNTITFINDFVLEGSIIADASLSYLNLAPILGNPPSPYDLRFYNHGEIQIFGWSNGQTISILGDEFNGFVSRVPEPSAVFLLALGLAGVSFSRYKKKS